MPENQNTQTTPSVVQVDPVESVRGEVLRRIVSANVFSLEAVQMENGPEPSVVPYCRLTMIQSGEYKYDSQKYMSKTIIAEIDILTRGLTQTQEAGQLAEKIDEAFGIYDRTGTKREIPLPGWTGMKAVVGMFARGTAKTESERGLYYLPVMLYIELTAADGAKFEVS